jgi:WD40 repeat protein
MSVACSPDGNQIASGVGNKEAKSETVSIWCVETGELVCSLEGHSILVTSVAFASDGNRIASGSLDDMNGTI